MHVKLKIGLLITTIIILLFSPLTTQVHGQSAELIQEIITQNIYIANTSGIIIIKVTGAESKINVTIDEIPNYTSYQFKNTRTTAFTGQGFSYIVVSGTLERIEDKNTEGIVCEPALYNVTASLNDTIDYRLILLTVCSINFQFYLNNAVLQIVENITSLEDTLENINANVSWILGNITLINETLIKYNITERLDALKLIINNLCKASDVITLNNTINNVKDNIASLIPIDVISLILSIISTSLLCVVFVIFRKMQREEVVLGL